MFFDMDADTSITGIPTMPNKNWDQQLYENGFIIGGSKVKKGQRLTIDIDDQQLGDQDNFFFAIFKKNGKLKSWGEIVIDEMGDWTATYFKKKDFYSFYDGWNWIEASADDQFYGDHGISLNGIFSVGNGVENNGSVNPVPEPTTMLLLGTGLIGLAGFRKKFKRQ
jgi:hypothetical protein